MKRRKPSGSYFKKQKDRRNIEQSKLSNALKNFLELQQPQEKDQQNEPRSGSTHSVDPDDPCEIDIESKTSQEASNGNIDVSSGNISPHSSSSNIVASLPGKNNCNMNNTHTATHSCHHDNQAILLVIRILFSLVLILIYIYFFQWI